MVRFGEPLTVFVSFLEDVLGELSIRIGKENVIERLGIFILKRFGNEMLKRRL